MNLQIEESFFPKAFERSSVDEVRKRVLIAEERIKNGNFFTEEKFWEEIENQTENV